MLPRSGEPRLLRHPAAEPLILAVLLGSWWCLAVGSTLGKSATSDEPLHIIGGASYWMLDDYRMQPENGNLPQRWCAVPLVLAGWPLPPSEHPGWASSGMAAVSRAYLFDTGNPSRRMLMLARSFAAVWGVLVCLVVYAWSRELFGREGACLSLAFCIADTTLMANAPLATSDTCAAFFFTWSTLAIWRMLALPSERTTVLAAIAVAGLFVAKFSAPLEVLVGVILLAIRSLYGGRWEVSWRGCRRPVSAGAWLGAVLAGLAVVGATTWLVIWASFGFRYAAINPAAPPGSLAAWGTLDAATRELGGGKARLIELLGEFRVLPEGYLYGMTYVFNMMLRQSFFCGDYSVSGWWGYFPFTFLVKTPLPALAAMVCTAALALRGTSAETTAPRARRWYPVAPLLTLLGVYWAASFTTTLNIGHRHLLPTYPAIFILLGAMPALVRSRPGLRWLPWTLAACGCLVSLWACPNYLAFFNGIVRRDEAWHCLVDSNLDWGQEHYALEKFVAQERETHGAEHPIYGCLFDSTPQGSGVAAVTLLPTLFQDVPVPPLSPGTYCVSATHLQGIYLQLWGPWTAAREERYLDRRRAVALLGPLSADDRRERYGIDPDFYDRIVRDHGSLVYHRFLAQLRQRPPDAVINGAILVYRLDADAFASIMAAEAPAQAARFPSSPLFD